MVLIYTGQRLADLATLRWSQIDLERDEIRFATRKTGKSLLAPIAEYALQDLADCAGAKKDVMHGIASEVTYYFGPEARRVLLGWLFDIEESMRWDPRRYWHKLNPEEVERMAAQRRAESRQAR